ARSGGRNHGPERRGCCFAIVATCFWPTESSQASVVIARGATADKLCSHATGSTSPRRMNPAFCRGRLVRPLIGADFDAAICTIDGIGISMAAIEGLHQMVAEKDAKIAEQAARIDGLEAGLDRLERLVESLTSEDESH
ncbi:MAG: hypothetical protein ACOC8E_05500, partial [Planctomycetota bacterium]